MKLPTDNIFQLIKSMSASEKRYFKRHYASGRSLSTELFDYLNKMDQYDEQLVKKHFLNTKLTSNLKVYKVQLSDLILKSLVSYHNKKSIRSKIRVGLEEVEILMDKQLYVLASNRLKKIKKLCLQHEELEYIFSVMYFEILLQSFFHVDLKLTPYPMLEELNGYADTLKNIYRLKKVNFALNNIINNELTQNITAEQIDYYQHFFEAEKHKIQDDGLSLSERYYLNSALSMVQKSIFNNPEKEYSYKKKNVLLFEKHPEKIPNYKDFYFAAHYNYLTCCRRLEKFKELEEGIASLKQLPREFPSLEKNLTFVYYLEIKYCFQTKQFRYIKTKLEKTISEHIRHFEQKQEHLTALCFIYFVINNLILEDYHQAQFYLRRLYGMSKSLDHHYQRFFEILEFILHYESDNSFALKNLIKSNRRKIKKQQISSIFYEQFLNFLEKYSEANKSTKREMILDFSKNLNQYDKDGTYKLSNELILKDWISAAINGQSYAQELKKRKKAN